MTRRRWRARARCRTMPDLPPRLTLPSMTSIAFFMSLRSGVLIVNFTPPLLPSWQLESARLEFRKNEESALEERFPSDL